MQRQQSLHLQLAEQFVQPAAERAERNCSAYASASPSAYRRRGQKKPRKPSPRVRGTTCTWRCGTLWLTTLLLATNVPPAPNASGIAAAIARTRSKYGPISF